MLGLKGLLGSEGVSGPDYLGGLCVTIGNESVCVEWRRHGQVGCDEGVTHH